MKKMKDEKEPKGVTQSAKEDRKELSYPSPAKKILSDAKRLLQIPKSRQLGKKC